MHVILTGPRITHSLSLVSETVLSPGGWSMEVKLTLSVLNYILYDECSENFSLNYLINHITSQCYLRASLFGRECHSLIGTDG